MTTLLTRRASKVLATGIVLTASAACRDRGPKIGEYVLRDVDRKPVPETLEYQNNCVIVMIRGYIRIEEKNAFRSSYSINRNCAAGPEAVPDPGTAGTFTASADTVFFMNSQGASGGHGTIRGDTLTVQGPMHELRFVRKTD